MKSDKGQSFILIGIGLFMLGIVVLYIGLSQPKIVVNNNDNTSYASQNAQNTNVDENITYFQNNSENNNAFVSEKQFAYPVNLNTATVEDLMSVEGIGENRARQIVSYRNEIGRYTSVAQIKNISGIGDGVYEQISPYLTV